jgi:hypothetical protein
MASLGNASGSSNYRKKRVIGHFPVIISHFPFVEEFGTLVLKKSLTQALRARRFTRKESNTDTGLSSQNGK